MTQRQLCDRLVIQHNTHNYDYLGIVSSDECFGALNSPDFYSSASWNNWRGRHCGHWRSTGNGVVGSPERDDALWEYAHLSYGVYYRQNVDFFQRPPCCQDGWNESGGTEVVVWGWDPKEAVDHFGWQGAHVGWPFRSTLAGADCIVWLTGEEAFLECIKTVGSTRRRTSAGLWGFGQWIVQTSNTQFCPSGKADLRPGLHLAPNNLPFDSGVAIP
ncbi:hypothetical protein GBAR_LOCUS14471 [Geodia barretti]|uniref:Uncharacterized protein n=1 Tax=Geodia barretti TaxID=519541 RepID=A0AA35S9Z0_GEOBA|nr:hypothetical protein GBAR_LOCUS14471 [Geodia barretti]